MLASIIAAKNGCAVTLFEKNEKLGKKVYITGKGRCNVTNNCDPEELLQAVMSNQKFLYSAFYSFTSQDMMQLLEDAGVPLKTERGNRVFPVSDHSSDIIHGLERLMKKYRVQIHLRSEVKNLLTENGQIVCLIKPQFEAGRENVGKKGVVRDKKVHVQVIEKVIEYAMSIGFKILNLDYSPVKGPEGNIEYLLYLQNNGEEPVVDEICVDPVKVVEDSHVTLDKKKQENS